MWLFVLESFAALGLLIFMVWWTMFSGRRGGERGEAGKHEPDARQEPDEKPKD